MFCLRSLNDVDVEERRAQLKAHLEEFISQDRERVMSFPSSFSGNERKIVHEVWKAECYF